MYCSADHIQYCVSCKVLPISDAINNLSLPLPHTLPDHSVLIAEFDLFTFLSQFVPSCNSQTSGKKCRKNIRKIDGKFMCSEESIQLINSTIMRIEANVNSQDEVDDIYASVKSIFVSEIDKLPDIQTASSKHGKRALRKAAPFWNPELQQLWQQFVVTKKSAIYHFNVMVEIETKEM